MIRSDGWPAAKGSPLVEMPVVNSNSNSKDLVFSRVTVVTVESCSPLMPPANVIVSPVVLVPMPSGAIIRSSFVARPILAESSSA